MPDSFTEPGRSADTEGTAERRRGNPASIRLTAKGRIQSFVTERRETAFFNREGSRRGAKLKSRVPGLIFSLFANLGIGFAV